MSIRRRLKQLNKAINLDDGKKDIIFFNKFKNKYHTNIKGKDFELSEKELEEFKKRYGKENVVSIVDDI